MRFRIIRFEKVSVDQQVFWRPQDSLQGMCWDGFCTKPTQKIIINRLETNCPGRSKFEEIRLNTNFETYKFGSQYYCITETRAL